MTHARTKSCLCAVALALIMLTACSKQSEVSSPSCAALATTTDPGQRDVLLKACPRGAPGGAAKSPARVW